MQITPQTKSVNPADIAPERLANNSALSETQKIAEASRQFEAILLRQILAATQKPVITSKLTDNSTAAQIYRDMVTEQLADSVSKSKAFGLAKVFEKQLTHPAPTAQPAKSDVSAAKTISYSSDPRHPAYRMDLKSPAHRPQPISGPDLHHPHERTAK
jgi:peptidoglycan hydrolase FlgJ